jgi:hypothetical protein
LDVDLGISLAASGGQYGTIKSDSASFRKTGGWFEGGEMWRFTSNFLTEDPNRNTLGSRVVDEVIASVVPGINRALDCCRAVAVQGSDIYGASQVCHVRVADIGPLLVLKLNAFGGPSGRRLPKDAYDILLAVTAFIDGPTAAIKSFQAEEATGNRAYQIATAVWNELT